MLHTQADYFFVPPLNLLSNKLKLSPSIAGITLLAIGNGEQSSHVDCSHGNVLIDRPQSLQGHQMSSLHMLP